MIRIIAAITLDRAIGVYETKKGKLPWTPEEAKGDLDYFKQLTNKHKSCIIMGRKTFESMDEKVLPGRYHFILSRSKPENKAPMHFNDGQLMPYWVNKMEDAIGIARLLYPEGDYPNSLINIIGGVDVFSEGFRFANEIILTIIPIKAYDRYDTKDLVYFPNITKDFYRSSVSQHPLNSELRIIIYKRLGEGGINAKRKSTA